MSGKLYVYDVLLKTLGLVGTPYECALEGFKTLSNDAQLDAINQARRELRAQNARVEAKPTTSSNALMPTTKPSTNKCLPIAHCEAHYQECKYNPNKALPCPYRAPWRVVHVCTNSEALVEAIYALDFVGDEQ